MKFSRNFIDALFVILSLTLTALAIFFWVQSPLEKYSLQLVAFLVILFFISQKIAKDNLLAHPANLIIFTAATLLLVADTGGLESPIFFIVYFLLFGTALLASTPVVLALTILIMIFFAPSLTSTNAAIQLASLLLITPLAILFGRQYLQLLDQQGEIVLLKKTNEANEKSLAQQETNALIWLSLNLKTTLAETSETLSSLLADIAHLNSDQTKKLKIVHQQINRLLKESQKVKQLIDEETD
ncbi:MAG: hypothetical protein PHR64_00730 [Candidatus Shapirobacteria bacterium]|nr:hypothetical protein [Candidatus Shapirobacteria bacterium]MDD5073997.1 hypothetical protein [Candidatus Shapirobacteria bacterium]MDD5481462.1 hypothetical protein [Candidatus Shapirobacteria bacterium]